MPIRAETNYDNKLGQDGERTYVGMIPKIFFLLIIKRLTFIGWRLFPTFEADSFYILHSYWHGGLQEAVCRSTNFLLDPPSLSVFHRSFALQNVSSFECSSLYPSHSNELNILNH